MSIHATFVGRLGRDPETRYTSGGQSVTDVALASNHGFGDKQTTTWVKAVFWGKQGETISQHCHKGDQLLVSGDLYEDTYNHNGEQKKSIKLDGRSFEFVGGKKEGTQSPPPKPAPPPKPEPSPQSFEDFEDDIPF
jgi:single-strand DNA-binding protein